MSRAREMLLSDARDALRRRLKLLVGRNDLGEVFAAWLLSDADTGLSVDGGLRAALACRVGRKSYRNVAVLGFAAAAQSSLFQHRDVLRGDLLWLAGRDTSLGGTPAGFVTDAVAVLGAAVGTHFIADDEVAKAIAAWMAKFLSEADILPCIRDWERCLFAAAARLVEAPVSLPVPTSTGVAYVRVALRARGLLPLVHRSQAEADEETALTLLGIQDEALGMAETSLRAAAFDSIKRAALQAGRLYHFTVLHLSLPASDEGTGSIQSEGSMSSPTTKVFISYTHEGDEHDAKTLGLANSLRAHGIESSIDAYVPGSPLEGWPQWMLNQIKWADYVLVVCTETYTRRCEGNEVTGKGRGGKWEGAHITLSLYNNESRNDKFIPVIFSGDDLKHIPLILTSATHYNLDRTGEYEKLLRHVTDQPAHPVPPVGKKVVLPPRDTKPFKTGI
jgi:hypothetical protein